MSEQSSAFLNLKESPLQNKISRYLFYFIWVVVDTLFFVLGTICMVLMVANSDTMSNWLVRSPKTPIVLIVLAILTTAILVLLRIFKYENVVDHILILISYLMISFGFTSAFVGIQLFCSLIALPVTVIVTVIVTVLGLHFRAIKMEYTVIIFIVGGVFAGLGIIMSVFLLQKFEEMALKIMNSLCMSIFAILCIFMTINRMRLCVSYNVFYCSVIFRAFCLWLGMLTMFASIYFFEDALPNQCDKPADDA